MATQQEDKGGKGTNFSDESITQAVININSETPDARLKFLMERLVTHLHDFARETRLNTKEWMAAIQFLTATGQKCTDMRQEFVLLSDVLGLSLLVDSIDHPKPPGSTVGSLLGPFHTDDAEMVAHGTQISNDDKGEPILVIGSVKDTHGHPLEGVVIDVWETDSTGHYDTHGIVPVPYPIPGDGPVGNLLKLLNRHNMRPGHLHFRFMKHGYDPLTTALYLRGDPYENSDAVFGVKDPLLVDLQQVDEVIAAKYKVSKETKLLTYNFVIATDQETEALREENSKLAELRKQPRPPSLPVNPDIPAMRQHANFEAQELRKVIEKPTLGLSERGMKIPVAGVRELDAYVYAPSSEPPAASLPIYLFFHGGGFCIGSRFDDMEANRRITLEAHIVVVSLEYPLAPEHPFPQAVHDGLHALQWIVENANAVHPSASVSKGLIIGGTSAGGNIANAITYLNRDQDNPVKVTGQFLSVPPLLPPQVIPNKYKQDYTSFKQTAPVTIPPPGLGKAFIAAYKPDLRSPLFVPFNHPAGHTLIPPTYIQVCGLDSLRDEGLIYAHELRENGVETRVDLYTGLHHHFWQFFPGLTKHCEKRTRDCIEGILWLLNPNEYCFRATLDTPIAIIGAGPVGLYIAFVLAKAGIKVTVIEMENQLIDTPRAVIYFPAVLDEFEKTGILQDIVDAGDKNSKGCAWRDGSGNILASLDQPADDPHFGVCLGQHYFCEIVYKKLVETGNGQVLFNTTYLRHEQKGDSVHYLLKDSSKATEIAGECRYLIGTDGGRSAVRKSLGIEFKGFTWESVQLVATNFRYPLDSFGWKKANYIIDPVSWGIIVKCGKEDSWRFATAIQTSSDVPVLDEAIVAEVKTRLPKMLPGDTSQIVWEAMAPYKVHQRCASTFRKGNTLLAGDAAHVGLDFSPLTHQAASITDIAFLKLTNPLGALGLTTGILDAAHLTDSLKQVLLEDADPIVLDQYAEIRRSIFLERTSPISTQNLIRARSDDPVNAQDREEFFKKLTTEKDVATILKVGLPDYALSSTSKTTFATYEELTWFISVTKIDDWTEEKFAHEYKVVHANMTRQGKEQGAPARHYIQYENLFEDVPGTKLASWNYVTSLVFPNMFLVHAGLQDPGYRATAGLHIFCRLDQQGCLTRKILTYSKDQENPNSAAFRVLLFHERRLSTDDFSRNWLEERAARFSADAKSNSRVRGYSLWQDITPKNSKYLFKDSLFEPGSWHNFKGVEAFDFANMPSAKDFLSERVDSITENSTLLIRVVVSKPNVIF
ncbi:3-(3-hydroxy-phenyl)propionate 3-hydroxycinnamic acid hydroxylase [Fusarium phyllophilum]|uniref:3-(3-hydroxy-phenyl)propionate 3-hydroxycinnamic acid hydroxylase n=1 Tax=Fusarium phyllophilum TaxID=47803 RepID=A0A8H5I617_9HYPO|nr:3-(3-hydroxy-phenyl)propionate 3-hydroxycinnamic acid hydroxylase [Fusarium phyllophilum]